jgi:lipoprotein-releasing system ATP-binding protein
MQDQPLLQLVDVRKQFPQADLPPLHILDGMNLDVLSGQSVAITGPSGSGKSTLLNLLAALDRPTSGRILFEGHDLAGMGESALARLRNRRLGLVFQLHHLLPQLTALENVMLPAAALPGGEAHPAQRARGLLARVGLAERMSHWPGQLSGGERQRVAVARALMNRPAVLLADEPTGALDPENSLALAGLLADLHEHDGVTLIVVTHWAALAERMGRHLHLSRGRLEVVGGRA